jgi:hypothetical protein
MLFFKSSFAKNIDSEYGSIIQRRMSTHGKYIDIKQFTNAITPYEPYSKVLI